MLQLLFFVLLIIYNIHIIVINQKLIYQQRHGHDSEGGVTVAPHPFANIFSQMAGGGQGHTHLAPDGTVTHRPPGMMLLNMSQNPTGGGRNFQLFVNGNRVQTGAEGAEGGAAAAAQGAGRPPAGIEG